MDGTSGLEEVTRATAPAPVAANTPEPSTLSVNVFTVGIQDVHQPLNVATYLHCARKALPSFDRLLKTAASDQELFGQMAEQRPHC